LLCQGSFDGNPADGLEVQSRLQAGATRPLTPGELGELANAMVAAKDPAEADRLQAEIVRGFYGGPANA
jgi:hypothetical protein